MKTIAYIIGYRWTRDDDCRLLNLKITIDWLLGIKLKLKEHDINLIVIIIEQHVIPKFHIEHCIFKQLEYIFVYNDGYYNRGWGFNVCFKNYVADYYFFADGDIIMNERDIIHVFKTCFKYDAVNPYENIYDSTEEYMKSTGKLELIDLDCNFKRIFPKRKNTCFSGGIIGICKYSMNIINGWDERFRGRGWEDYAFTSKIELFLYSVHTYEYSALHLWHPYEINTTRVVNEKLHLEYATYNFYDYLNLINTYIEFGSPIKYAIATSIKHCNSNKKCISDDRYYFAKDFFNKLFKKYKNNKDVYLHLCNQLKQLNHDCRIKESGGDLSDDEQIQESGGLPHDEQDKKCCDLPHDEKIHKHHGDLPDDDQNKITGELLDVEEIHEHVDLPDVEHIYEHVELPVVEVVEPIKALDVLHEDEPIKDELERLESKFKNILSLLASCLEVNEPVPEIEPIKIIEDLPMVDEPIKIIEDLPVVDEPIKIIEDLPMVDEPIKTIDDLPMVDEPIKTIEDLPMVDEPIKIIDDLPVVDEPIKIIEDLPVVDEPIKTIEDLPVVDEPIEIIEDLPVIEPIEIIEDLLVVQPIKPIEDLLIDEHNDTIHDDPFHKMI